MKNYLPLLLAALGFLPLGCQKQVKLTFPDVVERIEVNRPTVLAAIQGFYNANCREFPGYDEKLIRLGHALGLVQEAKFAAMEFYAGNQTGELQSAYVNLINSLNTILPLIEGLTGETVDQNLKTALSVLASIATAEFSSVDLRTQQPLPLIGRFNYIAEFNGWISQCRGPTRAVEILNSFPNTEE